MRSNDIDGVTYKFVTEEEFNKMVETDELLEYATVFSGKRYGTPKKEVLEKLSQGIDVIMEINIEGALQIKNKFKDALFIFILPPSMDELKRRLTERNIESPEKIIERFKTAYKEINAIKNYNYVVVNDNLDEAVMKVKSIIISQKCRVDRIESLNLQTLEEELHEELVDFND